MSSRKPKKKLQKSVKSAKKVKPSAKSSVATKKKPATKKPKAVASQKKSGAKSSRKAIPSDSIPFEFFEHQIYASSAAYSLVGSSDPSELVKQVQIRCNDGWSPMGGVCYSGLKFYQTLIKNG